MLRLVKFDFWELCTAYLVIYFDMYVSCTPIPPPRGHAFQVVRIADREELASWRWS